MSSPLLKNQMTIKSLHAIIILSFFLLLADICIYIDLIMLDMDNSMIRKIIRTQYGYMNMSKTNFLYIQTSQILYNILNTK